MTPRLFQPAAQVHPEPEPEEVAQGESHGSQRPQARAVAWSDKESKEDKSPVQHANALGNGADSIAESSSALRMPRAESGSEWPNGSVRLGIVGHALIFLAIAVPTAGFIAIFSVMGFGDCVYMELRRYSSYRNLALALGFGLLLVLHVTDAVYWQGPLECAKWMLMLAVLCLVCLGCALAASSYPYAPLLFSLVCLPWSLYMVRRLFICRAALGNVLKSVALSLWLVVCCTISLFVMWMLVLPPPQRWLDDGWDTSWVNVWGGDVKLFWRGQMGCDALVDAKNSENCYLGAFLWWAFPFWLNAPLAFFGFLAYFLGRIVDGNVSRAAGIAVAVKVIVALVVVSLCSLYVAAAVAGGGLGVTRAVEIGLLLCLIAAIVCVGNTLGWDNISKYSQRTAVYNKVANLSPFYLDLAKAFGFFVLCVPAALYLPISALNQLCRRHLCCARPPTGGHVFTAHSERVLAVLRGWHWGSVLSKVTVWAILYLSLNVLVMVATVVFFSWVNEVLRPLAPAAVCGIFFLIGVVMFTIPVVPGVPVYLSAGVLIPASVMTAEDPNALDSPHVPSTFWFGLALACGVVFFVKLTAVWCEQQLIGRYLGTSVYVRSLVNVNGTEMRATRMLLSRPGLSLAKCTILVGGPDWPTSVLTGILKLSPTQMLFGTTPILLLLVPSVAAGGFQLLVDKSDMYESLAAVVTLAALAMQLAALVGALYFIDKAATEHKEELDALPPDTEVLALDQKAAVMASAWREATRWDNPRVGLPPKLLISSAAAILTAACWMSSLLNCFDDSYSVSSSIEDDLDGNPLAVVLWPFGWAVIGLFGTGWAMRVVYLGWARGRAHAQVRAGAFLAEPSLSNARCVSGHSSSAAARAQGKNELLGDANQ